MTLESLLLGTRPLLIKGNSQIEINRVEFDSRKIQKNDLFVATKGTQSDGHLFIEKAISQGAVAVLCEEMPENQPDQVVWVQVKDSAEALGYLASNFYGNPSQKLTLVGVTGTNGKTTTATLLFRLFRKLGYRSGLLSTVAYQIEDEIFEAKNTTPDALTINEFLANMLKKGCTHAFMEVSSHALVQHRVTGLHFAGGIFTNITHDHLDYHKTFAEYIRAKKLFFDHLPPSAFALVNKDDKNGLVMLQNCKAKKMSFALKSAADFKAKVLTLSFVGTELDINGNQAWFKLIGEFNAYNLTGIYAAAVLLGENSDEVLLQLSDIDTAQGRFEHIISRNKINAIVDYSHTPDALQNVLQTISQLRTRNEQVITVVGCGGNRDATKRPIMADIACRFSDKVILTSDNPRFEEPEAILKDMESGVKPQDFRKTITIANRREAIKTACSLAKTDDIILIAGKGHETYQEIRGVKYPFDDLRVVQEMFDLLF